MPTPNIYIYIYTLCRLYRAIPPGRDTSKGYKYRFLFILFPTTCFTFIFVFITISYYVFADQY